MKIVVSACLLGIPCRYDGCGKRNEKVCALAADNELIPVCPEQLGGLPTPRIPCEKRDGRIVSAGGEDLTAAFETGARSALDIALKSGAVKAILKEYSPSCGSAYVYDGTFTGRKVPGTGVFAELLLKNGITVLSDEKA